MGRLIDTDVIEAFIKNHSCCVGTDGVLLTVGEDKRWHNLLEYIPTAHDVCEWKGKEKEYIQNPHTKRLYSNEESMKNCYCNTCGKKIKVVE